MEQQQTTTIKKCEQIKPIPILHRPKPMRTSATAILRVPPVVPKRATTSTGLTNLIAVEPCRNLEDEEDRRLGELADIEWEMVCRSKSFPYGLNKLAEQVAARPDNPLTRDTIFATDVFGEAAAAAEPETPPTDCEGGENESILVRSIDERESLIGPFPFEVLIECVQWMGHFGFEIFII